MAANAWPGFVDILSAIVIMFVFFVLITAAALYFYTISYKTRIESQPDVVVVAQEPAMYAAVIVELERKNRELENQIQSVLGKASQEGGSMATEAPSETRSDARYFDAQSSEQPVVTSNENRSMVLFYKPRTITVDAATEAKIARFINELSEKYGAENLEIILTSPRTGSAATRSRANNLAVARLLNVRKTLLNLPLDREKIQLGVVEIEAFEGSENWTRLHVEFSQ